MSIPNGTASPFPEAVSSSPNAIPPVVGINYGNSYASIAVFTKESGTGTGGVAECIANEDGERQISCVLSFSGEERYIGNEAKNQLIKNAKNTIIGFRDVLGKKFSELTLAQRAPVNSCPIIQHPTIPDTPAYKVDILEPAPKPLPPVQIQSHHGTPAASHLPTPRSEPIPRELILTAKEVNILFLTSLLQSAHDFLGKPIQGAVITVPSTFTDSQKSQLKEALEEAGVKLFAGAGFKVYQLLEESAAAAVVTTSEAWTNGTMLHPDRTQLIIDVGASSLSLHLLSIREGLFHVLASSNTPDIGADKIDEELIKFFAKEFTKKTKVSFEGDQRALAKLRLALPHTKRTLSASPGAATCSVESLKDGLDFTSSINRMRFDLIVRPIYSAIAIAISTLLSSAKIDPIQVDELVYVGGTASLPGLDEHIALSFAQHIITPFTSGTVVGGGVGDPTTVLSRGCAIQGALIHSLLTSDEESQLLLKSLHDGPPEEFDKITSRGIALWFPSKEEPEGRYISLLPQHTPLPARRTIQFDISLPSSEGHPRFGAELVEVEERIHIEVIQPEKLSPAEDEEDEEEEEPEEVKTKVLAKHALLGVVQGNAKLPIKSQSGDGWMTTVQATITVDTNMKTRLLVTEVGAGKGETVVVTVP